MFFFKSVFLYVSKTGYTKVLLFSSQSNSVLHQTLDYHSTFSKVYKIKRHYTPRGGIREGLQKPLLKYRGMLVQEFLLEDSPLYSTK